MSAEIIFTIIMSLISIFIYAKALSYLLKRIKIKTNFKKELAYTFALFIPINIAVFLITFYQAKSAWNGVLLLALIAGIIFPIKYLYKLKWKPSLMISVMWFIAIIFIGLIMNIITGLLLSGALYY
ncbi:hypothetical protein ACFLZB_00545 [Nanoarchaeota archaeon]